MRQQDVRGGLLAALIIAVAGCAPGGPRPGAPGPTDRPRDEVPEPSREAPLTLALLLPQTGSASLQQYGALILEGVELAVAGHEAAGGRPIELHIEDSRGSRQGAAGAAAALAAGEAIALIGPLLPDEVSGAIGGRGDAALAIISPSSPDQPGATNAYSLNAGDTRGAELLGRWAVANGGGAIGILHPLAGDGERQARAFADAVQAAGGNVVMRMSYGEGTTTFGQQMERLATAGVTTLFIPASERDIPQIAPQLAYYGLGGVQVLGGEAWTGEAVLRTLPARTLEGVVAATPLLKTDDAVAWEELVGAYEARHRRTLSHPFPGLGYDAAGLVLATVRAGADDARDVARRLEEIREFRGATGVISIRGGRIEREPFLVRVRNGTLSKIEGPTR